MDCRQQLDGLNVLTAMYLLYNYVQNNVYPLVSLHYQGKDLI